MKGRAAVSPNGPAFNAIWHNLDLWVRKGIPPPRIDQIKVENGKPVLDGSGNVTGGVRSPYIDVPVSTWFGNSTGASFCRIAGHEAALDPAHIKELYATHEVYVQAVTADVTKLVAERQLIREDGDEMIAQAKNANIPVN